MAEARAIESAKQTNKLIVDSSKGTDHEVHWTGLRHSQMKLRREPGTCFWCGDRRGAHPWKICPAKGKTCSSCGSNDHFARVCLEDPKFTVRDSRSKPSTNTSYARKGANGQCRDPRQRGLRHYPPTQSRDLHYTDTSFDDDCAFTYSLEAQVHSVVASRQAKRYFFYEPSTLHDRFSVHSSHVPNRHRSNMQHNVPQHAAIISARCRPQTIPLPSISLRKLETVGT